ncbi:MAG: GH3 auxin-responsive promoter family protein, partial [Flavobacteriales bacterium]|nr:GH3 auxin-responsive promoter family protein [Flavobacteriales bacterium]
MPFNSVFSWFIKKRLHQIDLFRKFPHDVQAEWFEKMMKAAEDTQFGKEHGLQSNTSYDEFKRRVPVRTYEEFKPYIDRSLAGEDSVSWPGKVKWFAKSSGTTSNRSKFIPVTKDSLEECHYKGGKDLLAIYCDNNPNAQLYTGKSLVMGGSSELSQLNENAITGDLSAIIIENLPIWVELRRTPNKDIALMDNWEEKIEKMARATMQEDVSIVAGVPSWTLVLFKKILEISGAKSIKEIWPNFELYMHGGVSFKPYRNQFEQVVNAPGLNYYENYNASEGFFGVQDRNGSQDMLLMLDYGIFYEFMPLSELGKENPDTLSLDQVELGVPYALIITTNGG